VKQLVVFDMDDTLFLEKDFVKSGFLAVNHFLIDEYKINGFYNKAWERFCSGQKKFIFNHVLNDLNYDGDGDKLVIKLLNIYRTHMPKIKLFDDAKWAIQHYSSACSIALLSDGYLQTQKNKAEALGIFKYFNKMYFTDYWGREFWKPNPFVFQILQKDFSANNDTFVYISDNPLKDFIAPNKLGWKSIYIKREFGIYNDVEMPSNGKPNLIINSLYDLRDILPL